MPNPAETLGQHGIPHDFRSRIIFWLVCLVVFVSPLPLGGNRPWAWSPIAFVELLTVAGFLFFSRHAALPESGPRRSLYLLTLAFAAFPLLQIIPLPDGILQVIGMGSLHARSLDVPSSLAPISIDVMRTMDIGLRQGAALLMALVMLQLFQYRDVRWQFVNLLVAVGVLNAIVGLVMFFTGDTVVGSYVNKNHFAGLMCMVLPLAVGAAIRRLQQCRSRDLELSVDGLFMYRMLAVVVLALALLLSVSRGGLFATGLAMLLVLMLFARSLTDWSRKVLWLAALAVLSLLVLALVVGFSEVMQMYTRGFNNERVVQWMDTLRAVPQYWLLGSGVGTYDYAYPAFKSVELGYPRFDHAHNDYLEFLLTMGVVGLLLFIGMLGAAAMSFVRRNRLRRGVGSNPLAFAAAWSVLGALIHAGLDFNLQIPANFLVFLLVLMLLASYSSRQGKRAG